MTATATLDEPAFGSDVAPAKLEKLRNVYDSVLHDKSDRASIKALAPVIQGIILQDPTFGMLSLTSLPQSVLCGRDRLC